MPAKYWAFFVFIFIVGTILGLVIEGETLAADQQNAIEPLLFWQEQDEPNMGSFITNSPAYFSALFHALVWDFSFLTGNWVYVKWIIWAPLLAMVVWGVIATFAGILQKVLG